jgi:hypothetical protein
MIYFLWPSATKHFLIVFFPRAEIYAEAGAKPSVPSGSLLLPHLIFRSQEHHYEAYYHVA